MKNNAEGNQTRMKKIRKAIGLLNSMVIGGEKHSDQSRRAVEEALNEIKSRERILRCPQNYIPQNGTCKGCNEEKECKKIYKEVHG